MIWHPLCWILMGININYSNHSERCSLQVRNDVRTNREPILYLFSAEPILNQFWTNLMAWSFRLWFTYVRMMPSVHILVQQNRSWIKNACRVCMYLEKQNTAPIILIFPNWMGQHYCHACDCHSQCNSTYSRVLVFVLNHFQCNWPLEMILLIYF